MCHVMLFWKLSYEKMFRHMVGCFSENKHMMFFAELPGKRACDIFLELTLERVWKGYKYNPADNGCCVAFVHLATLLVFADHAVALGCLAFFADHGLLWLHREKCTKGLSGPPSCPCPHLILTSIPFPLLSPIQFPPSFCLPGLFYSCF